jgi:ferrochelatase
MASYDALLLVSFGGPERAEDVMPFLRRVTAGRDVPARRLAEVAEHYYAAGGASPINAQCRALLEALRDELAGLPLALYWGNRNWHPLLEATLGRMRDDGVRRALAFVTSAYGSFSSCRQYLDDIARARQAAGASAPAVDKLRLYYNHPRWVEAWVASLRRALAQAALLGERESRQADVLFSAHSVPLAMAAVSPYAQQVNEAARLVAQGAGVPAERWQLVWQSRSGAPGSAWLGPDVCEVVRASHAPSVVVVPIGFVSDHMEVVHDLDVEAASAATERGARFVRAATPSTDPAFARMVRELVQERLDPSAPRLAVGDDGPWPDLCPTGHCQLPRPTA